jgi:pilus assembly protein CpaB
MRLVSILIVGIALVLAGVVFFVVPRLMNRSAQEAQQIQQAQPQRLAADDVLVAAHNLPAGLALKAEDVRWQRWPEEALDPNFIVREKGGDPNKDAVGKIVTHGIESGEPVTALRLLKPGDSGFLAAELAPGTRAVTVKIDPITGDGGFIEPLDRVDVLLTEHFTVTQVAESSQADANLPLVTTKDVASVILRNVKVLAIDQSVQDLDSKPKTPPGQTATLEVDLTQAEKLTIAPVLGTLSLVLRSHTLPQRPEPEGASPTVEDFQVSPFRAAALQQFYTNLAKVQQQEPGSPGSGPRLYHGAGLLTYGNAPPGGSVRQ